MLQSDETQLDTTSVKFDIDTLLGQFFDEQIVRAQAINPSYVRLWETMRHLNQSGGKRLRPYMVLLGYRAFRGNPAVDINPVAAAWELLHLCMLIHDDIIDKDLMRHGVKNVAGTYQDIYSAAGADGRQSKHLAAGVAILAGDLAHSGAHELIITSTLPANLKILAQQYLTAATFAVAGGELLDVESVLVDFGEIDPLSIAQFKTASYSFVGPLSTGADLAGASEQQLETIGRFGTSLGCGFQIADDILNIFGDEKLMGKPTIGDIREGKRTYIMQYAFTHASPSDRQLMHKLVGKQDITNSDADTVRDIITRSQALKAAEDAIDKCRMECQEALAELRRDGIDISHLRILVGLTLRKRL